MIISLPALAFFWFLRFIARVFVMNLHRHQDARERATMVQTYLALIREGENVAKPDERILILNALFRPGPGDAPDMAPPVDLLDIIKRDLKTNCKIDSDTPSPNAQSAAPLQTLQEPCPVEPVAEHEQAIPPVLAQA